MKLEGVPERGVGSGRQLTYHFAQARVMYLQSLELGNKASGPRADLCSHFSICKAGIRISGFTCFEFRVWKWSLMWMQSCAHSSMEVHWAFWSCHISKAVCSSRMAPWDPVGDPCSGPALPAGDEQPLLTLLESQPLYLWNDWVLDQVIFKLNIFLVSDILQRNITSWNSLTNINSVHD